MRISERVSRALLATRSDAIIAADKGGKIMFWNPGAERIFGHLMSDALGQSLDIIIPDRLRGRHWDAYRRVMETGTTRYGEGDVLAVPALRKDGSRISLEFTIALLRDEQGRVAGLVAILRDVTRRFEELRTLRRMVSETPFQRSRQRLDAPIS
jgi:PAS domain S-box-containing protein